MTDSWTESNALSPQTTLDPAALLQIYSFASQLRENQLPDSLNGGHEKS